jgi:carboxyl-terminal processing protease
VRPVKNRAALFALVVLAACGGSGNDAAVRETASAFAAQCVSPRTGSNDRQGSVETEKSWLRAWIDDTYLWYREVPALDATAFATPISYFNALKTPALTASGKPKDRFHFTYSTPQWLALSQGGIELGYGIEFAALSTTVPRSFVVAFTEPGSPAGINGIDRGAELVSVDGIDFVQGSDVTTLNNALFPTSASTSHTFTIRDLGAATTRRVTLTPTQVTRTPVHTVKTLQTASGKVGYLLFNDHIATSQAQLINAVRQLKAAGIADLVLDIRYNGGGYLDIASELASMIAGGSQTSGKTFERLIFNDKNPFGAAAAIATTPFHTTTQPGFSAAAGQVLPELNLGRVFVLTGAGTCSASESIINSLRGVDVNVVQIGAPTCGKPFGFFPAENCGTTYFAIQFQGVNEKGFGDYADGFVPAGSGYNGLPGCAVADDFSKPLGDPAEARLAAALQYRAGGGCPAASGLARDAAAAAGSTPVIPEPLLLRTPLRENRFYRSR